MAINLVIQNPKSVEEIDKNVKAIAEVSIPKDFVNIDTATISATMTDPDAEKLRNVLLNLINNLKSS